MAHIERGRCTRIGSGDIAKLRDAKLHFLNGLGSLANEQAKGSYASYISAIPVEEWKEVVEAPCDEKPGEKTEADFPALDDSAKTQKKQGAKPVTAVRTVAKPSEAALELYDPRHPQFAASRYLCTIINKYVCPRPSCG